MSPLTSLRTSSAELFRSASPVERLPWVLTVIYVSVKLRGEAGYLVMQHLFFFFFFG